jgi:hypothetical protein
MRENAIQDHKNSLLGSQDSGQTELKLSELTMTSIEFSRIGQNSIVMEWVQFTIQERLVGAAEQPPPQRDGGLGGRLWWWGSSTTQAISRQRKKYIFSTPVPPRHSPDPSFAPRLPAASSTSSQRLQNEPKSAPSARSTTSPYSHEHPLFPTRTTNTPLSQPSERYQ